MANLEVLALDTAVPQIRAPGAGDGYSVPRDMTLASGTVLSAPTVDATNVEVTNIKAKDGTAAASIADSTGVVSITANPILSAGTANGVLYLNASKVATSGSALTFDGTNLGIGTASPGSKLTVSGDIQILSTNYLSFSNTAQQTYIRAAATSTLAFGTNSTEQMRIDSSGNVGIGTASPGARLDVVSSTYPNFISNRSVSSGGSGSAAWTAGQIKATTTEQMSAGFGVQQEFVLRDADAADNVVASIAVLRDGADNSGAFTVRTAAAGSLTEKARIDSAGNLGLGGTPLTNSTFTTQTINGTNAILELARGGSRAARFYADGTGTTIGAYTSTPLIFITNDTERARIDASGNFLVGTTTQRGRITVVNSGYSVLALGTSSSSSARGGAINFESAAPETRGQILYDTGSDFMSFSTATAERARITAGGDLMVGTTNGTSPSVSEKGFFRAYGNADRSSFVAEGYSQTVGYFDRTTSDGTLVEFLQDGTLEGTISVSGNTVSYNAFAGSHWSQLQDGSKPDILRGTVMESINELCVWPDENNERLPKAKISDTAGSKKVYGVFMAWDNDWTETNDMYVTAVGAFICRVNGSVTVQEGDLLESNGDGTARVQADDIIRSSTIGKVTSTVKTHQYDDGSYCVPTVLYCG